MRGDDALAYVLRAIVAHRLRSLLTVTGIAIRIALIVGRPGETEVVAAPPVPAASPR